MCASCYSTYGVPYGKPPKKYYKRDRIKELVVKDPELTAAQLAERVGVSMNYACIVRTKTIKERR